MTAAPPAVIERLAQPRHLIVTLYGLRGLDGRQAGRWFSVAALVRLLADLGIDEAAVRSSVSRLKRRGMLIAEKVGGARRLCPFRTGRAPAGRGRPADFRAAPAIRAGRLDPRGVLGAGVRAGSPAHVAYAAQPAWLRHRLARSVDRAGAPSDQRDRSGGPAGADAVC
nr:hypothetical protein [Fodinicola feengrottensis]